jgi:hypothetical protein
VTGRVRLRRVLPLGALAIVAAFAPRAARAQANTAELLDNAVGLYEDLQVERAVVMLRQVISPSSPYEVSRDQRVQAYKYLGAALALLGQRDSAVVYLRAAIERDPFVELDPQQFTPTERNALAEARRRTFAVAARPVAAKSLDPRTERTTFSFLTTHAAQLRAELREVNGSGVIVLHDGENDGVRETAWNGLLGDGRLAPPGRYVLQVNAVSALNARVDSAQVWFDIRHDRPPLEDTLATLGVADLLPERHPPSAARRDLLRGAGVAAAALFAQSFIADRRLSGGGGYAAAAALTGLGAGSIAYVVRQRHRDIPANAAENVRRQAARAVYNAEVVRRNAERIAVTRLELTPAAGAGQ